MKLCDAFKVTTSRPLNNLNVVSIAELVQYTDFDPRSGTTPASSADQTIRNEWKWELEESDLNYLDFRELGLRFRDGSSIKLKAKKNV